MKNINTKKIFTINCLLVIFSLALFLLSCNSDITSSDSGGKGAETDLSNYYTKAEIDNMFIPVFQNKFQSSVHNQDITTQITCTDLADIEAVSWTSLRNGYVSIKLYSEINGSGFYYTTVGGMVFRDSPKIIYLSQNLPFSITWKSFQITAWY